MEKELIIKVLSDAINLIDEAGNDEQGTCEDLMIAIATLKAMWGIED